MATRRKETVPAAQESAKPAVSTAQVASLGGPEHDAWIAVAVRCGLTDREAAVTWFLAQDRSEADVGKALGIAKDTVHAHIRRIYAKLGVHSRVQLMLRLAAAHRSSGDGTQRIGSVSGRQGRIDDEG